MKLADLGKREMAIIYILGFLLSAALLYKFVVSPELDRYRTARDSFDSQQQRKMRTVSRRDALLEEYLVLRARADEMQKLLFNATEADDFQEQLSNLSEQTKNELTSITPKESKALVPTTTSDSKQKISEEEAERIAQLSEIAEMPLGVSIRGKYNDIISLFRTLEGFKELMVVDDVGVTSARETTGEVETRFSLNLIHTRSEMKPLATEILANISAMSRSMEPSGVAERVEEQQESASADGSGLYAVQVGVYNTLKGSENIVNLLKSKNYEPSVTEGSPHYVLVGKFTTRAEADEFAKQMQKKLPTVKEYIIKRMDG